MHLSGLQMRNHFLRSYQTMLFRREWVVRTSKLDTGLNSQGGGCDAESVSNCLLTGISTTLVLDRIANYLSENAQMVFSGLLAMVPKLNPLSLVRARLRKSQSCHSLIPNCPTMWKSSNQPLPITPDLALEAGAGVGLLTEIMPTSPETNPETGVSLMTVGLTHRMT
uniref:Matrix protein n=1 Tax=Alphacoronavirus sp. TaxID=1906673 RepID=A0A3G3NGK6_9ALPC|nr:matrix protein [Alphacoronavirus sp.]